MVPEVQYPENSSATSKLGGQACQVSRRCSPPLLLLLLLLLLCPCCAIPEICSKADIAHTKPEVVVVSPRVKLFACAIKYVQPVLMALVLVLMVMMIVSAVVVVAVAMAVQVPS